MLVMTFFGSRIGMRGWLLEYIAHVGTVSALDGCSDEFVELVVVNAPEVGAVGSAEDCIGDVGADFLCDGLSGTLFSTNDGLMTWLMWMALSCASAQVVMVGSKGSWRVDRALAMAHVLLGTDVIATASVEWIREKSDDGVAMQLMSSFSMPFLGLPRV